jgi:uncharacterized membrane protein
MRYTGIYAILLVLHLLTVAFVIGPVAIATPLSARAARAGRGDALRDHARTTRVYTIASVVTVLLGSAMVGLGPVGDQWSMGQLWISTSYALWLLAVVLLLAVVVPAQKAALAALADGGGRDEGGHRRDARAYAGRISAGGGAAALAFGVIIALMVLKPGT